MSNAWCAGPVPKWLTAYPGKKSQKQVIMIIMICIDHIIYYINPLVQYLVW